MVVESSSRNLTSNTCCEIEVIRLISLDSDFLPFGL